MLGEHWPWDSHFGLGSSSSPAHHYLHGPCEPQSSCCEMGKLSIPTELWCFTLPGTWEPPSERGMKRGEVSLEKPVQAGMLWKTQNNWKYQLKGADLGVFSFRKFSLNSTAWIRPPPPLHPGLPQSPLLPSVMAF